MTSRTDKEMAALLNKINELIGPLDRWSDQALVRLNNWMTETGDHVQHEWIKRDSNSEADA